MKPTPTSHACCEPLRAHPAAWPEDQLEEAVRRGVHGAAVELERRVIRANRRSASCWSQEVNHIRRRRP